MRFKIPSIPLSALLKGQRQWRKTLQEAFPLAKPSVPSKPARARTPRMGLSEVHAFGSNPGRLRMLEYAPPLRREPPTLVVVLHGCLQTADQFDRGSGWGRLARDKGFVLLYPEQTPQNNHNRCFNWFRPSAVARDRGELMSIRQMIEHCVQRNGIRRDRIFVQGLSAGAAMTSALLAVYPDLFAGAQLVGGLPYGAARDAMTAMSVMRSGASKSPEQWGDLVRTTRTEETASRPPLSIWQGAADRVVSKVNGEASLAQWLNVYGLDADNGERREDADGVTMVWKDRAGRVLVEYRLIDNLDHGLPVAPRRGTAERQPYMLEGANSAPQHFYEMFVKPV